MKTKGRKLVFVRNLRVESTAFFVIILNFTFTPFIEIKLKNSCLDKNFVLEDRFRKRIQKDCREFFGTPNEIFSGKFKKKVLSS